MRIFALELNNDIKGIPQRDEYVEGLISRLPDPDLVVLPELSRCSYMASQEMWRYADDMGRDTSEWAVRIAKKYDTYIGTGYLDREDGHYYNRYMIAGPDGVCGTVSKSEGETAVFRQGDFGSVIRTPFGRVGVAICYDSRRRHFYDNVRDEELSLILFPHGAPADPKKPDKEHEENDKRCLRGSGCVCEQHRQSGIHAGHDGKNDGEARVPDERNEPDLLGRCCGHRDGSAGSRRRGS